MPIGSPGNGMESEYTGDDDDAGSSIQKCPLGEEDCREKKSLDTISIRGRLFFDGTLNNRTNTDNRLESTDIYSAHKGKKSYKSYENDYTNIAKLEKYVTRDEQADHSFSLYIEGPGTEDEKGDEFVGYALGTGDTGVKAKAEKGIQRTIDKVKELQLKKSNQKMDHIYLDLFGFSRGAAVARYFIHAALQDKENGLMARLAESGVSVNGVKIKFMGLYDTVASHGLSHSNDTSKLHLAAIREAEKVVQLAAADEYRKNFPLTNIDSAGEKGVQKFLPGSHSDIGGGYIDRADEKDHEILVLYGYNTAWDEKRIMALLENEKKWLIETGWHTEEDIRIEGIDVGEDWKKFVLKATRTGIRNRYSRIPLRIMADYARKEGIDFNEKFPKRHSVPEELKGIKEVIDRYLNLSKPSIPGDWRKNAPALTKLRHEYLHFSSRYGGSFDVHKPRFANDDSLGGEREREIHEG